MVAIRDFSMFERLHQRKARCGPLHNDDHHNDDSQVFQLSFRSPQLFTTVERTTY